MTERIRTRWLISTPVWDPGDSDGERPCSVSDDRVVLQSRYTEGREYRADVIQAARRRQLQAREQTDSADQNGSNGTQEARRISSIFSREPGPAPTGRLVTISMIDILPQEGAMVTKR